MEQQFCKIFKRESFLILQNIIQFLVKNDRTQNSVSILCSPIIGPNDKIKIIITTNKENIHTKYKIENSFFNDNKNPTFSISEIISPTNDQNNLYKLPTIFFMIFPIDINSINEGQFSVKYPSDNVIIYIHSIEENYSIIDLMYNLQKMTQKKLEEWMLFPYESVQNSQTQHHFIPRFFIFSDFKPKTTSYFSLEKFSINNMNPIIIKKINNNNFILDGMEKMQNHFNKNDDENNFLNTKNNEKEMIGFFSNYSKNNNNIKINKNSLLSAPKKAWQNFIKQLFFYNNNNHTQSDLFKLKSFYQLTTNTIIFLEDLLMMDKKNELFVDIMDYPLYQNINENKQYYDIQKIFNEKVESSLSKFYKERIVSFTSTLEKSCLILPQEKWLEFIILCFTKIFINNNKKTRIPEQQKQDYLIDLKISLNSGIFYHQNLFISNVSQNYENVDISIDKFNLIIITLIIYLTENICIQYLGEKEKLEQFKNYLFLLITN